MHRWSALALFVLVACADDDVVPAPPNVKPPVRSNTRVRGRGNFIGVFQPRTATWKLNLQRPGWAEEAGELTFAFGSPGDAPLIGDWDGDGVDTQGTWAAGTWSLSNKLGGAVERTLVFGAKGDQPLVGDWDGDGVTTFATFRAGLFTLRNATGPEIKVVLGGPGDIALAGDFDGDGLDTVGVFTPAEGSFHVVNSLIPDAPQVSASFTPSREAQPLVGDWDDNGVFTVGLRHGSGWTLRNLPIGDRTGGAWSLANFANSFSETYVEYGDPGDVPVVGNWDPSRALGYPPAPWSDFFVLAADFQPTDKFAEWQRRGVNTVIRIRHEDPGGTDVETFTAEANRLGLRMIREPRVPPSADNDEVGLLAFFLADEPDVDIVRPPSEFAPQLALLRAPGVTRRPALMNFAGWHVLNQDKLANGPGDSGPDDYARYIALEDWVSQDIYPLGQMRARIAMDEPEAMETLPLVMDKLRRWAPTKPQFAYIESSQSNRGSVEALPLSAPQFRAQVWSAIVHGARGIFYFSSGDCGVPVCLQWDLTPPDVIAEMTVQNARIKELASVLQGAVNPRSFGVTAALPLDVGWRALGDERLIIAVNYSTESVKRWIRIVGPAPASDVREGDRVVSPAGEYAFEDSFEPYGVRIYQFASAPAR